MSRRSRIGPAVAALLASVSAGLAAQSDAPAVRIGAIASQKSCTVYQQSAGQSGLRVTPWTVSAYSSWRTWLVKDCVDNFASMRTSLEAALGSSGGVVVRPGARYVVSGRISDVSGEGGPAPTAPDTGEDGFSVATRSMFVNMDVTVKDQSGRIVFGGLLTNKMEVGSDVRTPGFRATQSESGQALYTKLQHQVALAVARMVAFHFTPLTVTVNSGRQIQLNYGAPLLALGTIVQATSPDGGTTIRYNVTSASAGRASAQVSGGGDVAAIVPGSRAIVIEPDDPAANGRRFEKVDLP